MWVLVFTEVFIYIYNRFVLLPVQQTRTGSIILNRVKMAETDTKTDRQRLIIVESQTLK